MGRAERMRKPDSASPMGMAMTSEHKATFQSHGLSIPQVESWVAFFGSTIVPLLMKLISLIKGNGPANPPTAEQMAALEGHGVDTHQAGMITAAGIDVSQLLKWLSDFSASGKLPQLIQLIMSVISILKPGLTPTPVVAQAAPPAAKEEEE